MQSKVFGLYAPLHWYQTAVVMQPRLLHQHSNSMHKNNFY